LTITAAAIWFCNTNGLGRSFGNGMIEDVAAAKQRTVCHRQMPHMLLCDWNWRFAAGPFPFFGRDIASKLSSFIQKPSAPHLDIQ
jgi:hypothetical protein